jgi:hypothetical protein
MTILYGAVISNSTLTPATTCRSCSVGGGAGKLKGGRHLQYENKPRWPTCLVTLMDKLDVPVDHLGRKHRAISKSTRCPGV